MELALIMYLCENDSHARFIRLKLFIFKCIVWNIRVKLNEQSQACLSYAIASEYLTLVNSL